MARGTTGVGVGGEYPSSSLSALEGSNETYAHKRRGGIFIMVTNFVLSFGGIVAVSVFLIIFVAAGGDGGDYNIVWRIAFAIGCVPPLSVFYFRLKMLNSSMYRRSSIKHKMPWLLVFRHYWREIIGTAGAWFLYDFVTFPNGLFSATILSTVVKNGSILTTGCWQLLLVSVNLPGVFIGAILVGKIGRPKTMALGFSGYIIIGAVVAGAYPQIIKSVPAFVVLYGLLLSSGNLGPGDCLGLVASESYATPVRGVLYGFSAAVGKAGAAAGTAAFQPIANNLGQRYTFAIAAGIGVVGVAITLLCVPDKSNRDLALDDQDFLQFLADNGWSGVVGESDGKGVVGLPSSSGQILREISTNSGDD